MSERHSLLDTILSVFAPVHREGHRFIAIFAIGALLLYWLWPPLGWLGVVLTAWCAYFFRDPERVTPLRDGLVISPADGLISHVQEVTPPAELDLGVEPRLRISVVMSVFDVHVNRSPVAGTILRSVYVPGLFLNAELDKASEDNERRSFVIEQGDGQLIGVVQIAGLVARRIVAFAQEGDRVGAGERIGLIRFGSRVDVYLPPNHSAYVSVGQRAIAGETVLADLTSTEQAREARAA